MNKISFGAKFEGMSKIHLENEFSRLTKKDSNHTIKYVGKDPFTQKDIFELHKDDVKTAEYQTEVWNKNIFSIQRLLGIYNILSNSEKSRKSII